MVSVNNSTSGAEAHLPFGGNGKSGNGSRQSGIWVLDQFTRWQSLNWDYAGKLQKAQMDVAELTGDPGYRLDWDSTWLSAAAGRRAWRGPRAWPAAPTPRRRAPPPRACGHAARRSRSARADSSSSAVCSASARALRRTVTVSCRRSRARTGPASPPA